MKYEWAIFKYKKCKSIVIKKIKMLPFGARKEAIYMCKDEIRDAVEQEGIQLTCYYPSCDGGAIDGTRNLAFRALMRLKKRQVSYSIDVAVKDRTDALSPPLSGSVEYPASIDDFFLIGVSFNENYPFELAEWRGQIQRLYAEEVLADNSITKAQGIEKRLRDYLQQYKMWKKRTDWGSVTCPKCGGAGYYTRSDLEFDSAYRHPCEYCERCDGRGKIYDPKIIKALSLPDLGVDRPSHEKTLELMQKHSLPKPTSFLGVYVRFVERG